MMAHDHDEYIVIVDNPIQLPCEVTGIPPPDITWKRSGEDLQDDDTESLIQLPNGALRINHVRIEDGGMYECIATSVAGTASKMITLNVQGLYYFLDNKEANNYLFGCAGMNLMSYFPVPQL